MSMTDPIADYLAQLRNAAGAKKKYVDIPASRVKAQMSKILLDAGFSHYGSHRDESRNLGEPSYPSIPRISESGSTANVAPGGGNPIASGSINNAIFWNIDNFQSRASASYVTGSHNVKLGYQGQYLSRVSTPHYNDMRLLYTYATPAANCTNTAPAIGSVTAATPAWCGLYQGGATRLFDGQPVGSPQGLPIDTGFRPPVPTSVSPGGSQAARPRPGRRGRSASPPRHRPRTWRPRPPRPAPPLCAPPPQSPSVVRPRE